MRHSIITKGVDGTWVDELELWIPQNDDGFKEEFLYYLTDSLINGTRGFSSIPANRLAIGLPTNNDAAATGYVIDAGDVNRALESLKSDGNPIRGLMTWSINWDDGKDKNGTPYNWEFVTRYGYLTEGEPPVPDKPTVPKHLASSEQTSTSVTLTWSLSTGPLPVLQYVLHRNGATLEQPVSHPPFTDSGLEPGSTYTYRIKAIDTAGNASELSAELRVSTQAEGGEGEDLTPPRNLRATAVTAGSVSLAWDPSIGSEISTYHVYRDGDEAGTTDSPATTYTDAADVQPDTAYEYFVAAQDATGQFSQISDVLEVVTEEEGGSAAEWAAHVHYDKGDNVSYQQAAYECTHAHASEESWTPDRATGLWSRA